MGRLVQAAGRRQRKKASGTAGLFLLPVSRPSSVGERGINAWLIVG